MEGCHLSSPRSRLAFPHPRVEGWALGLAAVGALARRRTPSLALKGVQGGQTPCSQHRGFPGGWEEHWQDAAPRQLCGMGDVAAPRL